MSSYFIFVMPPSFCDGGYVKGAGAGGGGGVIYGCLVSLRMVCIVFYVVYLACEQKIWGIDVEFMKRF